MTKKIESETKNKIKWFSMGVIVIIVGIFSNLIGGAIHSILMEILALVIIDIGALLIFKGFLI
jgi:energy-converting hydrogenase Eha subunit E